MEEFLIILKHIGYWIMIVSMLLIIWYGATIQIGTDDNLIIKVTLLPLKRFF